MTITLHLANQHLSYHNALQALGALRQEIRAANEAANRMNPTERQYLLNRIQRLVPLIHVASALADALRPQPDLVPSASSASPSPESLPRQTTSTPSSSASPCCSAPGGSPAASSSPPPSAPTGPSAPPPA
jgi:hypothetical protein